MKHEHGQLVALAALAAAAGLAAFLFIPQYKIASGTVASVLVALLVLKHLGLLAGIGSPLLAYVRIRFGNRGKKVSGNE